MPRDGSPRGQADRDPWSVPRCEPRFACDAPSASHQVRWARTAGRMVGWDALVWKFLCVLEGKHGFKFYIYVYCIYRNFLRYIYIQSVFWFVIINSALCPKVSMLLIQFQCLRSFFWRPIPNHLLFSLGFAINVTRKIYNRSLNALFVSWMRSLGIVSSRPSPEGTLATFVLHLPKSWLEQPSNSILKTWFIQIF